MQDTHPLDSSVASILSQFQQLEVDSPLQQSQMEEEDSMQNYLDMSSSLPVIPGQQQKLTLRQTSIGLQERAVDLTLKFISESDQSKGYYLVSQLMRVMVQISKFGPLFIKEINQKLDSIQKGPQCIQKLLGHLFKALGNYLNGSMEVQIAQQRIIFCSMLSVCIFEAKRETRMVFLNNQQYVQMTIYFLQKVPINRCSYLFLMLLTGAISQDPKARNFLLQKYGGVISNVMFADNMPVLTFVRVVVPCSWMIVKDICSPFPIQFADKMIRCLIRNFLNECTKDFNERTVNFQTDFYAVISGIMSLHLDLFFKSLIEEFVVCKEDQRMSRRTAIATCLMLERKVIVLGMIYYNQKHNKTVILSEGEELLHYISWLINESKDDEPDPKKDYWIGFLSIMRKLLRREMVFRPEGFVQVQPNAAQ